MNIEELLSKFKEYNSLSELQRYHDFLFWNQKQYFDTPEKQALLFKMYDIRADEIRTSFDPALKHRKGFTLFIYRKRHFNYKISGDHIGSKIIFYEKSEFDNLEHEHIIYPYSVKKYFGKKRKYEIGVLQVYSKKEVEEIIKEYSHKKYGR